MNEIRKMQLPRAADPRDSDCYYSSDECSNPVSWYRQHPDPAQRDVAFRSDMRGAMNAKRASIRRMHEDDGQQPENLWKMFMYNTYVTFNYIMEDRPDKALDIVEETERMLSARSNDFLSSVKSALVHITLTTKGYILINSNLSTEDLVGSFELLCDMDVINEAALCAAQSAFLCRYVNKWCILSKILLVRAISLNPREPEWHFMLSACLAVYRRQLSTGTVLPQELEEAETAVHLANRNPRYIMFLAKLLHSVHYSGYSSLKDMLKTYTLVKNLANDPATTAFDLKRCLEFLIEMIRTDDQRINGDIIPLVKTIVPKLIASNNSYIYHSVGRYYMLYEKDMESAIKYLKMAADGKCFGGCIDYVQLLFRLDTSNTNVVEIFDSYLEEHPTVPSQQMILSLIISFQILNKHDIVGALKYIDKLLDIKSVRLVQRMRNYWTRFCHPARSLNLLHLIFFELKNNLDNETLSEDNASAVKLLYTKFTEFNAYMESVKMEKNSNDNLNLDEKINFLTQNKIFNGKCCLTIVQGTGGDGDNSVECKSRANTSSHGMGGKSRPVETKKENWRKLKPNIRSGSNVFMRTVNNMSYRFPDDSGHHKPTTSQCDN